VPTRTVTILVRASGARKAAHDIDRLGGSLRSIGAIARTTSLGIGAVGAKAISTGISFNKMMETQTIALSGFVGGVKQANTFLNSLFEVAANTPFRFSDIVKGSRTLIAYGLSAKEAKRTLEGLGNAIAAAGGGSEEIERSVLALGQIASAGVLHAQDLNQLIQTGVVTVPKLAKRLGMSTLEFRKAMEDGSITSDLFFKKMRDSWEKDPMYKGAAAKQAKTFQGQIEKLHDYTERTLGTITEPLFKSLEKKVLPALVDISIELNKIFSDKNLDLAAKIDLSRAVIKRKLRPLVDEFSTWWEKNNVGEKLDNAFSEFMNSAVRIAAEGAKHGAKSFVEAWLKADNWTKVISGAWILNKFGLTKPILDQLFGRGPGKGGSGPLGKVGKTGVVPVYVTNWGGTGGGGPGGPVPIPPGPRGKPPKGKLPGRIFRGARRGVRGGIYGLMAYLGLDAVSEMMTGKPLSENAKDSVVGQILGATGQLAGGALGRIPGGFASIATGSLGVIGDQLSRQGLGGLPGMAGTAASTAGTVASHVFPFSRRGARRPLPPYRNWGPQESVHFPNQSPMFGLDRLPQPAAWVTAPITINVDGNALAQAIVRASVRRASTK